MPDQDEDRGGGIFKTVGTEGAAAAMRLLLDKDGVDKDSEGGARKGKTKFAKVKREPVERAGDEYLDKNAELSDGEGDEVIFHDAGTLDRIRNKLPAL